MNIYDIYPTWKVYGRDLTEEEAFKLGIDMHRDMYKGDPIGLFVGYGYL